ncbi:MAG: carboxylesterase family protein [Caulobacteraceae bacterium]
MSDNLQAGEAALFPVVETAEGKVRGMVSGGIKVFRGLRYANPADGANRFRPPQPVTPWAGVRDAWVHGNICPQIPGDRRRAYADLIFNDFQPGGMGEDCLVLNLWTPTLERNAKKPVLVRFHGGGFYGGSSNNPGSDGEVLSRFGDVVVITVNHRLSALGYLYLGDDGEFADSGAAGMADLVECLRWVKRNAEAFGGDPGRVMILGQSGGGAKVSHLLGMPSARGLFHSAAVMSGSRLTAMSRRAGAETAHNFLKVLGLGAHQIKELQALPFTTLLAAQEEVEAGDRARGEAPRSFSPVLGEAIPHHPFTPEAPPESHDVPIMVSNTLDERTYREQKFDMTWEDVKRVFDARLGDKAAQVLGAYRDDDPKATPYLIHARMITDSSFRRGAISMAERKAAAGGAPVWSYVWMNPSPAYGGRYGATHASDVPYMMHDMRMPLAGPSAESVRLADELASAFVAMATAGNPNNPRLPDWAPYDAKARTTMLFGSPTQAADDPRRWFREFWDAELAQPARAPA